MTSTIELLLCDACGHPHFPGRHCPAPVCVTCHPLVALEPLGRPKRKPPPPPKKPRRPAQFTAVDGTPLPPSVAAALHKQFRRDGQPREKSGVVIARLIAARKAKRAPKTTDSEVADGSADG